MKKKLLLGVLLLCMAVAMAGCGTSKEEETEVEAVTEVDATEITEISEEEVVEEVKERDPNLYYGYVHYLVASEGIEECIYIEPFWDYFLMDPITLTLEEAAEYGIDVDTIMADENFGEYFVYDTIVSFEAEIENYGSYDETITVSNVAIDEAEEPDYDFSSIEGVETFDTIVYLQFEPGEIMEVEDGKEEQVDFVNIYTDFSYQDMAELSVLTENFGITKEAIQENPFYTCTYYVVNQGTDFAQYQHAAFTEYDGEIPYESFEDTIAIAIEEFEWDGEMQSFATIMSTDNMRYYAGSKEFLEDTLGTEEITGTYTVLAYAITGSDAEWPTYVIHEFIQ